MRIVGGLFVVSVTRCWSKSSPIAIKSYQKVAVTVISLGKISPQNQQIFVLLLKENL